MAYTKHPGEPVVIIIHQLGFLWTADRLYVRLLAADSVRERPHSKDKKPRANIREYHTRRKALGLRHGDRLPTSPRITGSAR